MTFKFENADSSFGILEVEPSEVFENLKNVKIVDVRTTEEFTDELNHIEGADLIPLDTLPEQIVQLPKEEAIVFVCRSGGRSARATAFALENGFENVYNMRGGMMLWNDLGLKTE
ncbi:MAG: rhodanese-like domain-containing protein [Bdellovibrionales bacterium]